MKKLLLLCAIALFGFATMPAKDLIVTKSKAGPDGYDYVKSTSTENLDKLVCSNPGLIECKLYGGGYFLSGVSFDVNNFILKVDKEVLSGKESAFGYIMYNENKIAQYSWIGTINSNGMPEYELIIKDEF